jgi:hypothetical protein
MDTTESSAPHAHPSTGDQDLHHNQDERPHACNDGWATLCETVVDRETGEGSEEYALYFCHRCAACGFLPIILPHFPTTPNTATTEPKTEKQDQQKGAKVGRNMQRGRSV